MRNGCHKLPTLPTHGRPIQWRPGVIRAARVRCLLWTDQQTLPVQYDSCEQLPVRTRLCSGMSDVMIRSQVSAHVQPFPMQLYVSHDSL